ncbi:MAG: HEPN domain-containing protein [candidate division KSB1 bacterium]|nr:HEPN domain-containing protein [candidate division KSB1 bacterium]
MINQPNIDLASYRIDKAKDLFSQAKLLHKNKKYDGSINRSYYAIFNAVRGLLALVELDSSKHSGILSYFDRYFVKTKIFDKEFSKIAHKAFDTRQENDYEDFYNPSSEESESQIKNAIKFISEIEKKLSQLVTGEIKLPSIRENK